MSNEKFYHLCMQITLISWKIFTVFVEINNVQVQLVKTRKLKMAETVRLVKLTGLTRSTWTY